MPWPKPAYGLVISDDETVGGWKTTGGDKLVLNLEPGQMDKFVALARDSGAMLQFLIYPEDTEPE